MKYDFEVGENEIHHVKFIFKPFLGEIDVYVDDKKIVDECHLFTARLTVKYEFEVGEKEKHKIRTEVKRKIVLSGPRSKRFRFYVDDKLIKQKRGW